MEFTNSFHVPVDVDTTFATLTDLEKVAPCLPGATLDVVDGDAYTGKVKVKVGPITVVYQGTARMAEVDHDAKRARIDASGKETRGSGTAKADVVATLKEVDGGTEVTVVTDLNVTGKPAQFGRGVMADVGSRIIDAFAERLRDLVTGDGDADEPEPEADVPAGGEAVATGAAAVGGQPTDTETTGPRRIAPDPSREDDALDLMEVAGAATAKRLVPLVAALAVVAGIIWWLRRR